MRAINTALLISTLFFLSLSAAAADTMTQELGKANSKKIVRYKKNPTSIRFDAEAKDKLDRAWVSLRPLETSSPDINSKAGAGSLPEYPELPKCESDKVRRLEVGTPRARKLDYFFYAAGNKLHEGLGSRLKTKTIPYKSGWRDYKNKEQALQSLAFAFHIRCLPTRVHFVTVDKRYFMEYREGKSALQTPK